MKFNVNEYVKVRLTESGINELKKQYADLRATFPSIKTEFTGPAVDEDGYSRWQMHSLMSTFGHLMHFGCNVPFETEILIELKH